MSMFSVFHIVLNTDKMVQNNMWMKCKCPVSSSEVLSVKMETRTHTLKIYITHHACTRVLGHTYTAFAHLYVYQMLGSHLQTFILIYKVMCVKISPWHVVWLLLEYDDFMSETENHNIP